MEPRFKQMALSRAERSVRTGKAASVLPPHYLLQGDTTNWGSVVLDDIVIACCGVQAFNAEMSSMWIAVAIKAQDRRIFHERLAGQRLV